MGIEIPESAKIALFQARKGTLFAFPRVQFSCSDEISIRPAAVLCCVGSPQNKHNNTYVVSGT